MTTATPHLASITFDCTDALATARFWSVVLDRPVPADATSEYTQLAGEPVTTLPEDRQTAQTMDKGRPGLLYPAKTVGSTDGPSTPAGVQ